MNGLGGSLAVLIREGQADAELDAVQDAINARRTFLSSQAALALAPGVRVRIIPSPNRRHETDNRTGTVVKVARTTVHLTLDQPARGSTSWRFPASSLRAIDE